jgi:hypothetical protein
VDIYNSEQTNTPVTSLYLYGHVIGEIALDPEALHWSTTVASRRPSIARQLHVHAVQWLVAGLAHRQQRCQHAEEMVGLRHAGLVELDAEGRFVRLELETAEGMLTLHPDTERSAVHGNVVRRERVDPIEFRWSDDDAVAIDGDPFGSAVAGWRGRGWRVGMDLSILRADDGHSAALELDGRGIPLVTGAQEWALET